MYLFMILLIIGPAHRRPYRSAVRFRCGTGGAAPTLRAARYGHRAAHVALRPTRRSHIVRARMHTGIVRALFRCGESHRHAAWRLPCMRDSDPGRARTTRRRVVCAVPASPRRLALTLRALPPSPPLLQLAIRLGT